MDGITHLSIIYDPVTDTAPEIRITSDSWHELVRLQQKVKQKTSNLRNTAGGDVMCTRQFKFHVNQVKNRKAVYKRRKTEVEEMVTERDVLLRTTDILAKNFEDLKEKIESFGGEAREYGIMTSLTLLRMADQPSSDVEELKKIIASFKLTSNQRPSHMAPLKKKRHDLQRVFDNEDEVFQMKQAKFKERCEQAGIGHGGLELLIEKLEERREHAGNDSIKIQQQISEMEAQTSVISCSSLLSLDDQSKRSSVDLNYLENEVRRRQMLSWRILASMFDSKLATAKKESNLDCEEPIGDKSYCV
ncbi:hypothetical protein RB195_023034 [Necator americanus]|uniref:Uncharacterized protein n=1 Tax=Necator americanus TaxID=51031 RepID=A0ABR1EHL0_NECAM